MKTPTQKERAAACAKRNQPAYICVQICGANGKPQVELCGVDTRTRARKLLRFLTTERQKALRRRSK